MKYIKLFFITLLLLKSSFSLLCINSPFDQIFPNSPRSFQVQPLKEACFKYKLTENKNTISLIFSVVNSHTAEVLIYKAQNLIMREDNNYINYEDKYNIIENSFREIDVKDFYEYVYIIIRDAKNYFFYDNIILYDSELPINLEANEPMNIKYFMKNNKYLFYFSSKKNLEIVYSCKIQKKKLLSIEYDRNNILEKQLDENDIIINLKNENGSKNKLLKIIVENNNKNINDNIEQDFSIIIYEKDKNEFIEVKGNNLIKINYIKNNLVQNFYFFCDISKYATSSSINIKLDYNAKINKYINIISDIKYSLLALKSENFINLLPEENKIEYTYDINSDENIKFFFEKNDKTYLYKYIILKLEVKNFGEYFNQKYFTISLSKPLEQINLENIEEYHAEIIDINSNINVPSYYKLNLNKEYNYIFSSQNQDYMTLIKGDLLIDSSINKNYIDNQNEIIIISDTSDLTIQISDIELNKDKIYIEKIKSGDVTIIENERFNEEIKITIPEEYCNNNKKKYFIGSYNKEKYGDKGIITKKYWKPEDGAEIELYFKNNLSTDNESIFPSSDKYKILPYVSFTLDSSIDLFSFNCNKPGTISIRPLMKTFKEKTHIIGQNSITFISLNSKEEILQLTSPLIIEKNCDKFLYLSIQTIQENNDVIIKPETNGLFNQGQIKENKIMYEKIDIDKYKLDELAIRIISDGMADIEIIEVIHYNFSEYYEIKDEKINKIKKNNFVKFIDWDSKKIKININGLSQVPIYYSLVKLAINDTNYIPPVYNFKNNYMYKLSEKNEEIEIENKFYGKKDNIKEYIAFIFSIKNINENYEYDVQIKEVSYPYSIIEEKKSWIIIFIIVLVIIILLIGIIIYCRKKRKNQIINIENIPNNQPLYPNKKYVLSDILNNND